MTVEKRKPLTRRQVLELCLRQEGRCGCGCGFKLDPMGEGVIDEHVLALELTGSNDLSNRALWRTPCAKAKTAKQDAPTIAKAKRQAGETGQRARREKRGKGSIPSRPNAWPKGRKLPTKKALKSGARSVGRSANGAECTNKIQSEQTNG